MNNPPPKKQSLSDLAKLFFDEAVRVIAHDMPLLMHGSGDVQPSDVNPESVQILSELTADYIANLVQSAMDAHEILNDGPQRLPPPPLPRDRAPPIPSPPTETMTTNSGTTTTSLSKSTSASGAAAAGGASPSSSGKQQQSHPPKNQPPNKRQKRLRPGEEFWDEPLPEPKIKGQSSTSASVAKSSSSSNSRSRNKTTAAAVKFIPKFEGVPIDEWVGVAGVDFWETSRARKAHISAPTAITTQCFIFPICHDVGLYGKVLDVQSARRALAPLMVDKVIMDMVKAEGASLGPSAWNRRRRDRLRNKQHQQQQQRGGNHHHGTTGDDDDDDNDDPEESDLERKDGATWPGLEYLLPVHVMDDIFGGGGGGGGGGN